jgi:NAD(P)-dependent dehydrogenase (short-subunit alcohol dehydrogenase family)
VTRLLGRVAIVTGAGQGIGRAIARCFAEAGAAVLVAERSEATGARVAEELRSELSARAEFVKTDVGVKAEVAAMVARAAERFGGVHVLVNNAWSGGGIERLERKTDAAMEGALRVGLVSAFWSMQAAFPWMRDAGWGRIVNVCSLNGVNAHAYTAEYNAAKEGLRALTRTAAREWARHGICANVICPAAATPAYQAFAQASPANAARLLEQNPMGRMGDPERDVAPVALFLASDDARYLTGNTLFADGGSHINGVSFAPELPD